MSNEPREFKVLMADDSMDDFMLVERAFQKMERVRLLGRVGDGDEVVSYLEGAGPYADRDKYPFPDLLLLDLKMPRRDGFEVLRWLQSRSFPGLVVIVLSGSDRREDMTKALGLGAHYYQTKQLDLGAQIKMLRLVEQYMVRRT